REPRVHEVALLRREEAEGARQLEERPVRDEAERLLVVRRRYQARALGDERQPGRGGLVDVRVEEDRVVATAFAVQELEERGRVRPLRREPRALLGERVGLEEEVPLGFLERGGAAGGHGEAADAHGAVSGSAGSEVRRPGPVDRKSAG